MQAFPRREYRPTYEQFGWEYLGAMASAQIWRKPYDGERPEAFTQPSDIEGRRVRTAAAVSVSLVLSAIVTFIAAYPLFFSAEGMTGSDIRQLWGFIALCGVFALLLMLVLIKILKNRNR